MTTFSVNPIALGFAPASSGFVPARLISRAKRFAFAAQRVSMSGNYTSDAELGQYANIRLGRLERNSPVVDRNGNPASKFQHDYQRNVETTEAAIRALTKEQLNLASIVQGLLEAQQAISEVRAETAASAQAVEAQSAAQRVRDSYPDPNILTAENLGGVCIIKVAAHQRHYLDPIEDVAVEGDTIGGLGASTVYYVGYLDPDLAGGVVNYIATQVEEEVTASQSNPFMHKVGSIQTPANTGGGSTGDPAIPPWKTQREVFL